MLHVVEQDRRVGQDHALDAGVGDVALVPERDVLERRARRCRAGSRARPLIRSVVIGLRLCGIDEEPFCCAGAKRLGRLEHLGALEVADLGRQALEAGAGERDRAEQGGVAIARDDLRGDVLAAQPQAVQDALLELR